MQSPATVSRKNTESLRQQGLRSVIAVPVIYSHGEVPMQNQHPGSLPPRNNAKPSNGVLLGHLRCSCTWGVDMSSYIPSGHSLLAELWEKKEASILLCTTALCLSPDRYITSTSEGQTTKEQLLKAG